MQKQNLIIRIDESLKNKLKEEAEKLSLSLSSYVRMVLTEKFNNVSQ